LKGYALIRLRFLGLEKAVARDVRKASR